MKRAEECQHTLDLLDALCEWMTRDIGYMPSAATALRDRYDAYARGSPGGNVQNQRVAAVAGRPLQRK